MMQAGNAVAAWIYLWMTFQLSFYESRDLLPRVSATQQHSDAQQYSHLSVQYPVSSVQCPVSNVSIQHSALVATSWRVLGVSYVVLSSSSSSWLRRHCTLAKQHCTCAPPSSYVCKSTAALLLLWRVRCIVHCSCRCAFHVRV